MERNGLQNVSYGAKWFEEISEWCGIAMRWMSSEVYE